MTFSIVARSPEGRRYGVAVASKFLAVGSAVPAAEAGVGALATQAYANLTYRAEGLGMLRSGTAAADVVSRLTGADQGRDSRQVGVVGSVGEGVSFTGTDCHDWAGGVTGDGYAAQGNILTGPEVLDAMQRAWTSPSQLDFPDRLVAALAAGDAAGGDRRGRQSAALLVVEKGAGYGGFSDVAVDLRVDDHGDPVTELSRLLRLHRRHFTEPDPAAALPLSGVLALEVRTRLRSLGHAAMDGDDDLDRALASWAGVENYEERLVPGKIDVEVLEALRELSGG